MAQFFGPQDPNMYSDIGNILGAGLGGVGQYAVNAYQRPAKVQQLIQGGATPAEAEMLVDMPPAQQMQFFTQRMKQSREDAKRGAIGGVLGANNQGAQNQTVTNENRDLNGNLEGLSDRSTELTNKQRRDAAAASGLFDLNELEKIDKMLSREDEAKEKRLERQENRTERQEKLQRKDIHETTKKWKQDSKKADSDIHAFEEMSILRENPEDFTPGMLRRILSKAGFGEYFKGKEEEAYGKITEGLVFEKAAELASTGKMTAALMDRVRMRFPALENTPEGAEIITNILGREAAEKKVHSAVYNELRKAGGWKKGSEPIDILEQVDEIAEPIIEQMRKEANEALKAEIGYSANDDAVEALTQKYDPSGMPEGRIAKDPQTGEPMAKIVQGKWVAL